ncbi:DUF7507 domain-containing protein [Kitasatospora griseola]|uniref:DUF7507 domain-containing protein n=1 Tax=Kitasatospora griseola TaxID=2064 RepID=UPI00382CCE1D
MTRLFRGPGRLRSRTARFISAAAAVGLAAAGLSTSWGAQAVAPTQHRAAPPESVRAAASTLLEEDFTGATADPRFVAVGAACLTGGPVTTPLPPDGRQLTGCPIPEIGPVPPLDSAPFGYLRITDAGNDQNGAVLFDQALPAGNGLDVTFDQWQYGSTTPATPADGISFFLVNGDVTLTHPGAFGGSLGYAQKLPDDNPASPFLPGVDSGYLGVGLDVLGNYFGDWEHRGNGCPPGERSPAGTGFHIPAPGNNMVTVRGPGDGIEGYCFLTATTSNFTTSGPWPSTLPGTLQGPLTFLPPDVTPPQAQTLLEPSRRRVHVHMTPAPSPVLTIGVDFNDGAGERQVLTTPAPQPVPSTYKFGFAGSTGFFTDVHLIRNVVIGTDDPLPSLNLVKQAHRPLPADLTVGTPVDYDFVVTNSGNVPIDNLAVNDPKVGPITCPVSRLDLGQTVTCTATYVVTAADASAGHVANTAQATGTTPGGPVTSPPSSEDIPVVEPPGIDIVKQVDAPGPFHVGDTVPYTYIVSNTGGTEITDVHVQDDRITNITCDFTTLAPRGSPGDATKCHGTYVVTPEDADVGQVTNHATAFGTTNGAPINSVETQATIDVVGPSSIALAKEADTAGPVRVGDTVHYTYTVTNTGQTVLDNVFVSDDHSPDVTCDTTTLNPGQSTLCHAAYLVTEADLALGHLTNRAQAVGDNPQGEQVVSPPEEVTLPVVGVAELGIEKTADSAGPFHKGDTVKYTYTVTNTGTAAVHGLSVTDDHVAVVTCDVTTLNPGESTLCHGSYVVTAADVPVGHVTNTAHADGVDPDGQGVQSPPAEATVPVVGVAALTIEKTADSAGPFHVGDTVSYTYTVTNTGTAAVHSLSVADDRVVSVTCDVTTLNPGESTLCHGSYVVTAADVTAGHVTNTAHANGTDPEGQEVQSPPGEVTVPVAGIAELAIEKVADSAGPFHVGDTVSYTYTVTNTGTAAVHSLKVADDHVAVVTCGASTLNPGASTLCHGSYVIAAADVSAGHVTNTARAEGADPEGRTVVSPPGEVTVPVVGEALLVIQKAADSAGPFHVGDTVDYTYTVTNTGTAAVHDLAVSDDRIASVACDVTTLNPGGSTFCHGSYVITAADVSVGHVTNTARAHGADPEGRDVQSPPGEATIDIAGDAVLTIGKTADSAGPFRVGDTVDYTYTVTNAGTAPVHGLVVSDDLIGSVTCDRTTLPAGGSTLCHGSYVVTAADVSAGHVTNTAHASGIDPEDRPVESPPGEATVPVVGEAELVIEKVADSAGPFHVGDTVNYTYTVTNTGTAAVHNLSVTDDHVVVVTCDATTLNPGASTLCHGSYVVAAADVSAGHVTNTAHAEGTDPEGRTVVSPPADATVPVAGEGRLSIEKTADSAGPFRVGDTVDYTYTVTNIGTAAVHNVTVADDHVAGVTCNATTLNPGQSTLCHGSYVITAADVTAGHVTNTAHANGVDPEGQEVKSPPVDATVPVVGEGRLSIEKTADSAGPFRVGDTVHYTYTVTNTGTAAVHNLTVTDDHVASVTCDATTLNPGQSTLCHGSYVVTAADVSAGHVTNTAHASGIDPEDRPVQSPPAEVTVPVVGEGQLSIEKAADSIGPFHVGDTVHYTYTVTNTGTAVVHNIAVADDRVTSVTCEATTLNPGASTLCHGSYTITAADAVAGHVTNTAHANGTDPHGGAVQSPPAEATVPVVGEAQLSIVKKADATGPFRVGDTVTYTYTVTNTGAVAIHDVTVTDDRVASVTCDTATLNPGQSTVCHGSYSITEEDVEAGHVTNTARAKGVDPEGDPVESLPGEVTVETTAGASSLSITKQADVSGSAHVGDTVTYTYTVTNTGTTVLTDVAVNDDRVAQATCDARTLNPGESTTCHGTYVVTEEDAKVGHVTNTATATARDPQGQLVESRPVSLCVTVSECPEKDKGEGCVKVPRPTEPPKHGGGGGGGGGHLPETGSPAGLAAMGLAGGGLLTLGGVLLYRARRRANADRFVG